MSSILKVAVFFLSDLYRIVDRTRRKEWNLIMRNILHVHREMRATLIKLKFKLYGYDKGVLCDNGAGVVTSGPCDNECGCKI